MVEATHIARNGFSRKHPKKRYFSSCKERNFIHNASHIRLCRGERTINNAASRRMKERKGSHLVTTWCKCLKNIFLHFMFFSLSTGKIFLAKKKQKKVMSANPTNRHNHRRGSTCRKLFQTLWLHGVEAPHFATCINTALETINYKVLYLTWLK